MMAATAKPMFTDGGQKRSKHTPSLSKESKDSILGERSFVGGSCTLPESVRKPEYAISSDYHSDRDLADSMISRCPSKQQVKGKGIQTVGQLPALVDGRFRERTYLQSPLKMRDSDLSPGATSSESLSPDTVHKRSPSISSTSSSGSSSSHSVSVQDLNNFVSGASGSQKTWSQSHIPEHGVQPNPVTFHDFDNFTTPCTDSESASETPASTPPTSPAMNASKTPLHLGNRDTGKAKSLRPKGIMGIQNIGNTCFMNSCLQCINSLEPITSFFLAKFDAEKINKNTQTKGKLSLAFREHLTAVWESSSSKGIKPWHLKDVISQYASRFLGYDQQDAQEFLRFLLDGLHEELNQVQKKPQYQEIKDDVSWSDEEKGAVYWKYYCDRNDSIFKDLFCGQLRSVVICRVCKQKSTCFDVFWDLSVPIPAYARAKRSFASRLSSKTSKCTLDECLKAYTEIETLEGVNSVYCSKCKQHREATKQISLFRLPRILVIQIKRFAHDTPSGDKLVTAVNFPTEKLNLSQYCSLSKFTKSASIYYDLVGVSHHVGSLGGGHYTADCLSSSSGEWFNLNDSEVTRTNPSKIDGSTAYLLFYRQRDSTYAV